MNTEYTKMDEIKGGVDLDKLKYKKMPKTQKSFDVQIRMDQKTEKEPIEILIEKKEVEEIVDVAKKAHKIEFVDRRQEVEVNRVLVLERLLQNTNEKVIEQKKKTIGKETELAETFKEPIILGIPHEIQDKSEEEREKKTKKLPKQMIIVEKLQEIEREPEEVKVEEIEQEHVGPVVEKLKEIEPVEEEEVEKEQVAEKTTKKRRTQKKYEDFLLDDQEPLGKDVKINKKPVLNRLPKRERMVVRTSEYYMNNRKLYIQKIAELFKPYRKEIVENAEKASCDSNGKQIDFKLLTHQKVVRDYLNLYTPYRGLLLYHGLGSGKTCTSIAIAEGMKSERPIVLLTPASLKMNFFSELKKCGDVMYKKNQYWEFISISGNPEYLDILSKVLSLPKSNIQKKKGAWLVDITKKESNFADLTTEQQKEIDEQLNDMIRAKYLDLNYNGLNMARWKTLTNDLTKNPFDNTTVLVDEAHNLVSRIVNSLKKPKSLSYLMYDALMSANNSKIVLLSGTPIINYPNELAVLFNILRGYIRKWTIPLIVKSSAPEGFKVNREEIIDMFDREGLRTFDFVGYSGNQLTITRNPFGFVNTEESSTKRRREPKKGGDVKRKTRKQKKEKKVQNKSKKMRPEEAVYSVEGDVIQLTPEAVAEVEGLESTEGTEDYAHYDDRVEYDYRKGGGVSEDYTGVHLDESGNISDEDFIKEVKRILKKNHLEIIESGFTQENLKALPDDKDTFLDLFVDQENATISNENTFKKRILGLTSYFRSAQEKLMPSFVKTDKGENYHLVPIEMSNYQLGVYEPIRKEETDREKKNAKTKAQQVKKGEDLFKISSTYRIFSRAACNFAFPDPPGRPRPEHESEMEESDNTEQSIIDGVSAKELIQESPVISEEDVEVVQENEKEQTDYQNRIKAALKMLEYNPAKSEEEQYLTKKALKQYSPKFLKILENVMDSENRGLHLLYSQFRTIEGVGIMKLILEANGFAEFKIKKSDSIGSWEVVEKEEDVGKPKFVLYTGTETAEEKEIIRNIYNSMWEVVPSSITSKIREISSNNHYGEIIKLMMITSSGAEGINLKNTRFVHIVEPYWNMVRIEQVIGRARRICSHQDLPEELRNVKVFLYLSVFSEEQRKNKKFIELMTQDSSRLDGHPITTDENLFELATIKEKINNKMLNAVKETSIDCSLYNPSNSQENLVCYGFGKVSSNAFASYPTLEQDLGEMEEINLRKTKLKLKKTKPIDGVVYAVDPKTNVLYDLESYEQVQQGVGELLKVGTLVKEGKGFRVDLI
jgi:hypothetical protein